MIMELILMELHSNWCIEYEESGCAVEDDCGGDMDEMFDTDMIQCDLE